MWVDVIKDIWFPLQAPRQEAAGAGNAAGGRLLTIESALVTKGLVSKSLTTLVLSNEWKWSRYSPPALAVHYISYQWLCFHFYLYGFL